MTQEEIIRMAREAGLIHKRGNLDVVQHSITQIERLAALVAEAERKKFTAVGVIEDDVVLRWHEGITCDEAPEGATLYVRSEA